MSTGAGISEDRLLGGQVVLYQPEEGFRASTDSVLLGAAVGGIARAGEHLVDMGCGAGGALFVAAHHLPDARFTGVERDAAMVELAARGAEANPSMTGISIMNEEAEAFAQRHENAFSLCFANPPYFETGRISAPAAGKEAAYLEALSLDAWLKAMLFVTRPKGWILLIHRAAELARILARLDRQAGEIGVFPVRPYPGAEASRVIVRARKGLRTGPMQLFAGLDLHEEKGGALTARADGILRGAVFEWD